MQASAAERLDSFNPISEGVTEVLQRISLFAQGSCVTAKDCCVTEAISPPICTPSEVTFLLFLDFAKKQR